MLHLHKYSVIIFMSEVRMAKFIFKPNGKQIWLDWCEELKKRSEEVIETLKNEGVYTEACFISPQENAVYYFIEMEDVEKAKQAFARSTFLIDAEHRKARQISLEKVEEFKPLFYFENKKVSLI